MGILQRHPVSLDMLREHQKRIDRCRGIACFQELALVFGTDSPNRLESIIDGEPSKNEDGALNWSRKYRRYKQGSATPQDDTLKKVRHKARELGKPENLTYWRHLELWVLLEEPPASLETIRTIMTLMPHDVRKVIFHLEEFESLKPPFSQAIVDEYIDSEPELKKILLQLKEIESKRPQRLLRQAFSRKQAIELRNMRSLDGFIALVALAREGEVLEEDSKQALPARCAFEIFPLLLLDNPHLYACWEDLFWALKLAIWDRQLDGGFCYSEYTFENVKKGLEAYANDRYAKLSWSAGYFKSRKEVKKELKEKFPNMNFDDIFDE